MGTVRITDNEDIFAVRAPEQVLVIGHGVNTQGLMGAGFAAQIAARFPDVKSAYIDACRHPHACSRLRPGAAQIVAVAGQGTFYIANVASQDFPGAHASETWLGEALADMYRRLDVGLHRVTVRLPLIGAGIGGLDPVRAAWIIAETAVTVAAEKFDTVLHLRPEDPHTPAVLSAFGHLK